MQEMKNETALRLRGLVGLACALCLALVLGLAAAPAQAEVLEVVDQNGDALQVSDDITRIHVDKLEAGTHEWVKGAKMQIVDAETGDVVTSWTTGESTFEYDKALDAGKEYILREVSAPSGYAKVDDVTFRVNEEEGAGITIISPNVDEADWVELNGTYQVTLYDPLAGERVEYRDRAGSGSGSTAKTGDELGFGTVAALTVLAAASGAIAIRLRRKLG